MTVVNNIQERTEEVPDVTLTIGSFDGVHLGHRRILDEVRSTAQATKTAAAILTLMPHPRQYFAPDHAPNLLTSDAQKLSLLEEAGLDFVFLLRFGEDTARLTPQEFLDRIILGRCHAKALVVGHDFRFGSGAQGDYDFLVRAGLEHGFTVTRVPPLLLEGERVSSTRIRERVIEGDLEKAEQFLGRRYSIRGRVIPGRGIGHSIGFPTANIRPGLYAVPAHGVYIAWVVIGQDIHKAAVNIGIAPTIRHDDITIEAHILDFSDDIAGQEIEVVFADRLRPEHKFPTREALIEQIRRDVETIREHFTRDRELKGI